MVTTKQAPLKLSGLAHLHVFASKKLQDGHTQPAVIVAGGFLLQQMHWSGL